MNDIKYFIKIGLEKGYYQNLFFNTDSGDFLSKTTEYLLTVNVAQQLIIWRNEQDVPYNYSIHIEYSADDFKNNCFESFKMDSSCHVFDQKIIYRQKHHSIRNISGRIDIAILNNYHTGMSNGLRTFFGIEIKAINPQLSQVVEDIERLIDSLIATDPIGVNSLKRCFVAYCQRLDSHKKIFEGSSYNTKLNDYKMELRKTIKTINNIEQIEVDIEDFEVHKFTSEEYLERYKDVEDLLDYAEAAAATGAVAGIIISLSKKTI